MQRVADKVFLLTPRNVEVSAEERARMLERGGFFNRWKGLRGREGTHMGDALANFVYVFLWVYLLLLFAYILTSWIRLPYRPWLNRVQRFLYDVCDPYLRIFRRFLPPLGLLDLSPMVAIFVLLIVQNVLVSLLERL